MALSNKLRDRAAQTIDLGALKPHDRLRVRIAAASLVQWRVAERAGIAETKLSRILSGRTQADDDVIRRIDGAIDALIAEAVA